MFMEMARVASKRSTCFRLNVGALVVLANNPVAIGWNGQAPGEAHCAGNDCPGVVPGACGTIHAEVNALKKAKALLPGMDSVDLYVTHSPCIDCLGVIMDSPHAVDRLFFETPYRSTSHLEYLKEGYTPLKGGIPRLTEVYEVTPAGYVVEYFTRQVVELP